MQIDRKVGLIIGAVVSGLVATGAGVTVYVNKKKREAQNEFKEKKQAPLTGKLRKIVVHKGEIVGEEKKAAPPSPPPSKSFTFYRVDDESESSESVEMDEVHEDDIVEVSTGAPCGDCYRCGETLSRDRVCSGSNYTLFCGEAPKLDFLKPKDKSDGEEQ